MNSNLLEAIESDSKKFSKGQKNIANYITQNYDRAAYMTALKLGETVGVSQSTVVRFAIELGFDGYPEFQKALQDEIKNKLTSIQRIQVASNLIGRSNILETVLAADIDRIKRTLELNENSAFQRAVDTIIGSNVIYILATKSAASLSGFLGYYFNLLFPNVKVINTDSVSEMFERIMRIDQNDVIIGISFPRYSKRTVNALKYAKSNDAKVIAITDNDKSPIVESADVSLFASSDINSFVDSLVAPLSLINALIIAVGMSKEQDVSDTFCKLEQIWDDYNVYEKSTGYL